MQKCSRGASQPLFRLIGPSPLAVAEGHAQDARVAAAADGLDALVAGGALGIGDEARQHHDVGRHVLLELGG